MTYNPLLCAFLYGFIFFYKPHNNFYKKEFLFKKKQYGTWIYVIHMLENVDNE